MSTLQTVRPNPTAQKVLANPAVLIPSLVLVTSLPGTALLHPALQDHTFGNLLTHFSQNVLNLANGSKPERPGVLYEFKDTGINSNIIHSLSLCAAAYTTLTKHKLSQQEVTDFGKFLNVVSMVHEAEDYAMLTLDQRCTRLEVNIFEYIRRGKSPWERAPELFWSNILKPRNRSILQLSSKEELVTAIVQLIKATIPWAVIKTAYLATAPKS